MIIDVILYIFGSFIGWIGLLLSEYSIYPQNLLNGISFFGQKIATLDFFIFDIPAIMTIFLFVLQFEIYYFFALKIVSVINFFRGGGKLEL